MANLDEFSCAFVARWIDSGLIDLLPLARDF